MSSPSRALANQRERAFGWSGGREECCRKQRDQLAVRLGEQEKSDRAYSSVYGQFEQFPRCCRRDLKVGDEEERGLKEGSSDGKGGVRVV